MIRDGLNRLIVILVAAALFVVSLFVAIEAVASLAGAHGHVGPVDYRSVWRSLQEWRPGTATRALIYLAIAAAGAILLALQLPRRERARTVEVARGPRGPVLLETRGLGRYLGARAAREEWIERDAPVVRVDGRSAKVRSRPRTTRPWLETERMELREALARDLLRLGLEPRSVEIAPQRGRGARRVR